MPHIDQHVPDVTDSASARTYHGPEFEKRFGRSELAS